MSEELVEITHGTNVELLRVHHAALNFNASSNNSSTEYWHRTRMAALRATLSPRKVVPSH